MTAVRCSTVNSAALVIANAAIASMPAESEELQRKRWHEFSLVCRYPG